MKAMFQQKMRFALAGLTALWACSSQAALIGVSGPDSVNNATEAQIISAPLSVFDEGRTNTGQEGFDERQGVVLENALAIDGGSLAAGAVVDSHMIFLNTPEGAAERHANVVWSFSGDILGVMSARNGGNIANSDFLGSPSTTYPGAFGFRGLESNDSYAILGNTLTLSMRVTTPGDWIRVVTSAAAVPAPATLGLMALGLLGLGLRRRLA